MASTRSLILLILSLALCSCREHTCGDISAERLDIMSHADGKDMYEAYAVKCLDMSDVTKMDTLTSFVHTHYSKEMVRKYSYYEINIYSYDSNCEDGLINTFDCQTKALKGKVLYQLHLSYVWKNSRFDSLYVFSSENGRPQVKAHKVFE